MALPQYLKVYVTDFIVCKKPTLFVAFLRVLERVQGLWSEEETESAKHTAELVNRLEKSIEDKLKSKKEKTLVLILSVSAVV